MISHGQGQGQIMGQNIILGNFNNNVLNVNKEQALKSNTCMVCEERTGK